MELLQKKISKHFMFTVNTIYNGKAVHGRTISKHFMFTVNQWLLKEAE